MNRTRSPYQVRDGSPQPAPAPTDAAALAAAHPHDGYAYDGCKCICCLNVRALAALPAHPPAPPEDRTQAIYSAIHAAVRTTYVRGDLLDPNESIVRWKDIEAAFVAAPPAPLPLDVERLRAWFLERGWSIFMDDRLEQPLDPFPVLAARLATPEPTE